MKKLLQALLFILLISSKSNAQVTFERGYFIDNNNQQIVGFIKNIDWRYNPENFEFKPSIADKSVKKTLADVKAFAIEGKVKYIKKTVLMDELSDNAADLNFERNPKLLESTIFLRVLVEGKLSLYVFSNGNISRFFYATTTDTTPIQLINRAYLVEGNNVKVNEDYKKQLWSLMQCNDLDVNNFESLIYESGEMIKLFNKYNACMGEKVVALPAFKVGSKLKLSFTTGYSTEAITSSNKQMYRSYDFGSKQQIRLGIEAEIGLPFNNNKWSIVAEPNFRSFNKTMTVDNYLIDLNYKSVEVPIGVRYYMFVNNENRLFINGLIAIDIPLNASMYDQKSDVTYNIRSRPAFAAGFGYSFRNLIHTEVRWYNTKNITSDNIYWNTPVSKLCIIAGIKLWGKK